MVLRLTGVSALSVDVYPDRNSITWMDFVRVPSQKQIQTSKTIILSIWILDTTEIYLETGTVKSKNLPFQQLCIVMYQERK